MNNRLNKAIKLNEDSKVGEYDLKSEWIYGNWRGLGWGGCLIDTSNEDLQKLDYDPEFECENDIKMYQNNMENILKLPKMTVEKYNKELARGLVLKMNGKLYKY
jgi:hypothetical protein